MGILPQKEHLTIRNPTNSPGRSTIVSSKYSTCQRTTFPIFSFPSTQHGRRPFKLGTDKRPIQKFIIQNLIRWEFRNLQRAGVRILANPKLRRKRLVRDRCNTSNPKQPLERYLMRFDPARGVLILLISSFFGKSISKSQLTLQRSSLVSSVKRTRFRSPT